MVNPSCPGRDRHFLVRFVGLIHDGVEAGMAFDGVQIGITDGLPERRRFCLGCLSMVGFICPRNRRQYILSNLPNRFPTAPDWSP